MSLASTLTRRLERGLKPATTSWPVRFGKQVVAGFSPRSNRRVRVEVLYGILSGLLLTLSLPKPDLYPLAWIALVPWLLVLLRDPNPRPVAFVSYVAGFVFFTGTFYWMTETMIIYGGLSYISAVGIGLLFAVVYSLCFLVFGLGLHLAITRFGPRGIFIAAPLWVTIELIRTYFFFSGFPWMLSGYALVPYMGILQIVTVTGIYGLSFIATAVNSAVAYAIVQRSKAWLAATAAAVVVMWFLPILGETRSGDPVPVRIVQTNISLNQPWVQPEAGHLLDELGTLSTSNESKPRLVVWPETPAPFYLSDDADFRARMQGIARKAGAYFLVGYIGMLGEDPSNSAALLSPEGNVISRYDKMHLVPFGEYIPLKRLLFFAESFTKQVGNFAAGTEYTISPVDGHRISTAICYESIFPDLMRRFVKQGSELFVLITNDGWFGESSAPFQHLRMGVVRAVENRRYMVRDANTGISAIIDPYGRIESSTRIGVRTILDGTAHFRSDLTFYTRYGDVFAYANALAAVIAIAIAAKENHHARRTHRKIRST
jgi:apolipoprotein N-acyltransferase